MHYSAHFFLFFFSFGQRKKWKLTNYFQTKVILKEILFPWHNLHFYENTVLRIKSGYFKISYLVCTSIQNKQLNTLNTFVLLFFQVYLNKYNCFFDDFYLGICNLKLTYKIKDDVWINLWKWLSIFCKLVFEIKFKSVFQKSFSSTWSFLKQSIRVIFLNLYNKVWQGITLTQASNGLQKYNCCMIHHWLLVGCTNFNGRF